MTLSQKVQTAIICSHYYLTLITGHLYTWYKYDEEQIIHGYPIDGAMRSLGAEVIDGLFT